MLSGSSERTILFLDLLPYEFSTRARKLSDTARSLAEVHYISLQEAGRFGLRSSSVRYRSSTGVNVAAVRSRRVNTRRTPMASAFNLACVYAPGMVRLTMRALMQPAHIVVVENPSLLLTGLFHSMVHGSRVLFDAREAPRPIETKGSLSTPLSRLFLAALPRLSARIAACTAACTSHAEEYRGLQLRQVFVVRNVPHLSLAPSPPKDGPLVVACIGSLYPGRGLEPLIEGAALAAKGGVAIRVNIIGFASRDYLQNLRELVARVGGDDIVVFYPPCPPGDVAGHYAAASVGAVLYDSAEKANDSLSNKLFECIASGRGVLASDMPETRAIIEQYQCGLVVPPTKEAIGHALSELAGDRSKVVRYSSNAAKAAIEELNWDRERSQFLRALNSC